MFIGVGLSITNTLNNSVDAYPYANTEARAYVAAMRVKPDETRKALIDDLVGSLKTASLWDADDVCYLLAAHDEQASRVNLFNPTSLYLLTAVNSPAFETDRGWTPNGTDSYLLGVADATTLANFTQNSAMLAIWPRTTLANGAGSSFDAGTNRMYIGRLSSSTTLTTRIQTSSGLAGQTAVYSGTGIIAINRSGASAWETYQDGVPKATGTTASTTPSTAALMFGAVSSNLGYGVNQLAFAMASGSKTVQQHADLQTIIGQYMATIGAV